MGQVESSPAFTLMRDAAFEAGLAPDRFQKLVGDYFAAENEATSAYQAAELAKLGPDEQAISARVGRVNDGLGRLLPADEAQALSAAAGNALVVQAIERLINRTPTAAAAPVAEAQDSWEEISKLMNSNAYMGLEHQRDPTVVKRVDAYFARGGKRGG